MSARTGLRPSLDSGFVPGLRLPSIRQKRRPSNDDHGDRRQDRRATPAAHGGCREAHQLGRVGPLPRRATEVPSVQLRQLPPDRHSAAGRITSRRLSPLARAGTPCCKGEKGIAILAPIVRRLRVEDEATGEEQTIVSAPRAFRVVHVFDISQTDGDDLPEIPCNRLEGDGAAYDELTTYAQGLGFRVGIDELPGETNGLCNHSTQTITIRVGLAPAQQTKTLAHEIAHAMLHGAGFDGSRDQAELEAESVAYIVSSTLEIDSAAYTFGYLASWGAEPEAIRRSGHRIQQAAQTMLVDLGVAEDFAS
jgi:uncharacterized protein DUF955